MDAFQSSKIIFPHIMKTGGTTVNNYLHNFFYEQEILFEASTLPQLKGITFSRLNEVKFIRGHFQASVAEFFGPEDEFDVIGLLRNPVARVLSHYWHLMKAHDVDDDYLFLRERDFTLEDFLESPECRLFSSNYQTRMYGTHHGDGLYVELGRDHLQSAKAFIDGCSVVGVTEELSTFIENLATHFGLQNTTPRHEKTRSYTRETKLSRGILAKIESLNALDMELYEHGLEKISTQQVEPRHRINPLSIDQGGRMRWHASEPFYGHGWSDLMRSEFRHRWSMKPTASVSIARSYSGTMTAFLSLLRFVSDEQESNLKLFVDDVETELRKVPFNHGRGKIFVFQIPESSKPTVDLRFELDRMMAFTDVNPDAEDETKRGLALMGLDIAPTPS